MIYLLMVGGLGLLVVSLLVFKKSREISTSSVFMILLCVVLFFASVLISSL